MSQENEIFKKGFDWRWLWHYTSLYILTLACIVIGLDWIQQPFKEILNPGFFVKVLLFITCGDAWAEHVWWRKKLNLNLGILNRCQYAPDGTNDPFKGWNMNCQASLPINKSDENE